MFHVNKRDNWRSLKKISLSTLPNIVQKKITERKLKYSLICEAVQLQHHLIVVTVSKTENKVLYYISWNYYIRIMHDIKCHLIKRAYGHNIGTSLCWVVLWNISLLPIWWSIQYLFLTLTHDLLLWLIICHLCLFTVIWMKWL